MLLILGAPGVGWGRQDMRELPLDMTAKVTQGYQPATRWPSPIRHYKGGEGFFPWVTKPFLLEFRIYNKPLLHSGAAVTLDTSIYNHETRMPYKANKKMAHLGDNVTTG